MRRFATGVSVSVFSAALLLAFTVGTGQTADKVVRVGIPVPLTGPLATEGNKQKRGYDLWAEVVNNAGGLKVGSDRYKLELVYHDYQSNTPRAVQLTEKLINDDKVNFLFAPFGSGATKAASAIAEKYQIPMVATTASSQEVFDQGYKYLFGILNPNGVLTEALADVVRHRLPEAKKIAIIARNDLMPLSMAQEMTKSATKRGFQVVFSEKFAIGTLDHASALTQIRAAQPDWVFAAGYTNDLVIIRKQMRDLGVQAQVVTVIAMYREFVQAVGGPLAENVSTAVWWNPALRYNGTDIFGATVNFNKIFEAKYKIAPDPVAGEASAAVTGVVLQQAIERAGTVEPKKVREALASTDMMTFYGPVKFGANGMIAAHPAPVIQIQNGEAVVIAPNSIRQGELRVGVK